MSPFRRTALGPFLVMAVCLASCGASHRSGSSSPTSGTTPTGGPTSTEPSATSGGSGPTLTPPPVPSTGAYLGAWVNPAKQTGDGATVELSQLQPVQSALGRPLGILHLYTAWSVPAPVSSLQKISAAGAIPLLDWGCGNIAGVVSGAEDQLITSYATALKGYGKPLFLRYAWEMNILKGNNGQCVGKDPSTFVTAWQHIYGIFQKVGATNVAFVWCPGVSGRKDFSSYYPGSAYVDWIGIDGYDRAGTGASAFASIFGDFYRQFSGEGKPMMVAETGAKSTDQVAYIQSLATVLPSQFPAFKALVYFNAPGTSGDWVLQSDGLSAFADLARSSYFSFRG